MTPTPLVSAHREAKIRKLYKEYTEALNRLEAEKKNERAIDELKSQVAGRVDKLFLSSSSSMSFLPGNNSSTGMSSTSHSNMTQV
ncbi:hypothetical protein MKW94_001358 [Papaver nudicaule]|uniref:Uncharacterized protein n=1 Tax=Papaver nudicaule TaxID=74823 RepID=A0AA42AUZ9_PAPNU|nr:hypothetical protein [Papaver nudicaule]